MRKARLRRSPERTKFNSLFGEILVWMLVPFLLIWPISIALIHSVANNIADQPYDQALAENVRVLARLVRVDGTTVQVNFPGPAHDVLRPDNEDSVYFQVLGFKGELVAGDRDIPWIYPPDDVRPEQVFFRDAEIGGEDVRVAYLYMQPGSGPARVTIQVAETRNKRSALVSRIISGVSLPQVTIIPLAALLVWIGLSRGIEPLNRLQRLIRRRRPSDLSPIGSKGIPEEVSPLIIAFNDMMARLEQNLQAQQRFIADAAHQLRTPITGLKTQTDLALVETDPEQLRQSLRQIAASADRAAHLISQLLALARAEASHEKIHAFERADVESLLREATQEWVPRALEKNIDLGFEGSGWPLYIDGNPLLLHELIANLLDNAIKYTPPGGKVTARTRASEFALLEVEDDGPGISESDRDLVFERFYRVLGSEATGSGLGLAIVREIADLHGASVQVKANSAGRGALMQVVFPRSGQRVVPLPDVDAA